MKIAIIGAGAIGGYIGVKFAQAGETVAFLELEGSHLKRIQERGLILQEPGGSELCLRSSKSTSRPSELGLQDLVVLATKAHQIQQALPSLQPLLSEHTNILTVQNGIPWWYFQRHGGELEGTVIETVDPGGLIFHAIDPARILACVAYPAVERIEPGTIRVIEGIRFPVGELDGSSSQRVEQVAKLFNKSGLKSYVLEDIRSEIWLKAWGNLCFNPISALTGATMVDICKNPQTRKLSYEMMREAQEIAGKLGIQFRKTIEDRIAGAAAVGKHKTSMLQDLEAGRELEVDALVGSVSELGKRVGIPCPRIDAVYACAKLLDSTNQTQQVYAEFQELLSAF